jgi:2-dehydropantoate 2-reductase
MRFVVYGAGAVGGVVGGRLAQAGHEVVLIARGDHHDAIRDDGLRLVTPDAEPLTLSIPVVSHPAGLDFRDDDVVLLAMKSQHTGEALSVLSATAPPSISVVCVQNGVANEPAALRRFGDVYGVCVVLPALHLEPGVVEASSAPVTGILDVGAFPGGIGPRAEKIAASFASATFESVPRADIMRWKYGKLLNNLGNAVDALCGPDPEARVVHRRAWTEGAAVLAAAGIAAVSREEDAARRGDLFQWGGDAARSRPGSSSWQSLARATGSIEADYLNGEIVLLGRIHGVPTPVNLLLQQLAGTAAREGRRPGTLPIAELIQMLPSDE